MHSHLLQKPLIYLLAFLTAVLLLTFSTNLGLAQDTGAKAFVGMKEEVKTCLKNVIGETRFNELDAGATFTEADKTAIGSSGCFGSTTSSSTSTTTQQGATTTTVGNEQVPVTTVDPFGNMDATMRDCIKTAVGDARFGELSKGGAFGEGDKNKIDAAGCFNTQYKGQAGQTGEQGQSTGVYAVSAELEQCVSDALGAEKFAQIKSGGQPPSPGEMEKAKPCFEKHGSKYVPKDVEAGGHIDSGVEKCMRLAIGPERFEELKKGGAITEADRAAGYKCMGQANDQLAPRPEVKMPDELASCLKNAIGEETFNTISAGQQEPTADEQTKGEACFKDFEAKKAGKTALKTDQILPPPPEQVPFVKEDKTVAVEDVKATTGEKIEFEGTIQGAKEGQLVDVYVYSEDPKQVQATVGKDGKWTLSYDGDLAEGEHKVYSIARKAGELIRSAAKTFTVGVAKAQTTEDTTATQQESVSNLLVYYIGAIIGIAAAALIVYLLARSRHHSG